MINCFKEKTELIWSKTKNIIFAILSTLALMVYFDNRYNFILSVVVFAFIYFYYKSDITKSKREKKFALISALIFACLMSYGYILSTNIWGTAISMLSITSFIKFVIMFAAVFVFLNRLFGVIFKNIEKVKIFENQRQFKIKYFLIVWAIILLCWLPYFLRFFPANMSPDSYYVIHFADKGILSDLHTFGHTWFFGAFYYLGKLFTSNTNIAVSFGTVAQMLTLSLMFTSIINFLYKKGLNKYLCLIILAFFALSPVHASYSTKLWRDILFGGVFGIISMYIFEFIENDYKLSPAKIIILFLSLLIMLFFRNNGIYVLIFMLPLLIILFKKKKMVTFIFGFSLIVGYFIIKGPIFSYFNVAGTKAVEAYSIPLQQIARVISLDGNISDKENEYLNKIMDTSQVKERYSQITSDPIKSISNGDLISKDKLKFIKNWFTIFLKNPITYVEAYAYETIGYWYPDIEYNDIGYESKNFFEENVYSDPITPSAFNKIVDKLGSKRIPFSIFVWSIGFYVFAVIFAIILMLYNNKKYIAVFIPVICLWITIMISTPVFAELRYVYGIFVTIPILACIPFYKDSNYKMDKKRKNENHIFNK
jgi:hypothetical protein